MRNQPKSSALSRSYIGIVRLLIGVTVLFVVLAVVLSVCVDLAGGSWETVKDSIRILWHCVTLLVGGMVGLLARTQTRHVSDGITSVSYRERAARCPRARRPTGERA